MSELLEVAAHGVTAILATWLGLLVLTRARRTPGAPIFSVLCLLLVTWSVAIIVQRLGTYPDVRPRINMVEDAAAFLLPAVTTHLAISIAIEGGRRPTSATMILVAAYVIGVAAAIQAAVDPTHEIAFTEPNFAPFGIPGAVVAWAFAASRLAVWAAGVWYLVAALRRAGDDRSRQRQLQFALATVILGVLGGTLRILPADIGGPPWVGVSLVAIAVVLATYAVVAQQVFLAADVAGRAVRWSLAAGIGIVAYVVGLVVLDAAAERYFAIDIPIISALAVVVTLALFEPIADRVRQLTAGSPKEAAEAHLVVALGGNPMLQGEGGVALDAALARLVRTFRLSGAAVVDGSGARSTAAGEAVAIDDPRAIRYALASGPDAARVVFGAKRGGLAFTPAEVDALQMAAGYLGSSLRLAERQQAQATELMGLRAEQVAVEERGTALSEALADAAATPNGLYVHALGSLHATLNGQPLRRWGGEKAGSRQAEAIFAFLFDRGDRGVGKDEILELVWPDVDLDRADVAFHRTMLGLRSVLAPGRRSRGDADPITFANDRYRLDPTIVAWSDVDEFARLVAAAGVASPDDGLILLERARALYRGDYLDDCPFFGDSVEVEDPRRERRQQYVDLLVELGERYTARGDRTAAASSLRRAQTLADDDVPRLEEALGRLATSTS